MITAAKLVLAALMFGESALLHCRQGKRHSGGFCVLILALLLGTDIDSALEVYFQAAGPDAKGLADCSAGPGPDEVPAFAGDDAEAELVWQGPEQ